MIASEITANEYIDTTEYFFTYETLAINDDKILLIDPDGEGESIALDEISNLISKIIHVLFFLLLNNGVVSKDF